MDADRQLSLFNRSELPPHPGHYIQEELDERDWTQVDLARILDRPLQTINALIQGKKQITPETACELAKAFGTTPDFWMAKDAGYRLSLVDSGPADMAISERARVFEVAPIKEMQRRNWIRKCETLAELEAELCRFFEVSSLGDPPRLSVNARATHGQEDVNTARLVWCYRALKMAKTTPAKPYDPSRLPELKVHLRNLSFLAKGAEDVPVILSDFGIRFVVVEALRLSKIDGAAFWIDEASPVIAMSMRFDRIDYFWFTLMHELAHIEHRDASPVDADFGEDVPTTSPIEERADREGAEALIDREEFRSFVRRYFPAFSPTTIIQFANRIKTHPGIVVGQLHFGKVLSYSSGRTMLVKVRDYLCSQAMTDGFGSALPILT